MFEGEDTLSTGVVLAVNGGFVDGAPLDGDLAVGSVAAHHRDHCRPNALLHQQAAPLERDLAGFCKTSNFNKAMQDNARITSSNIRRILIRDKLKFDES